MYECVQYVHSRSFYVQFFIYVSEIFFVHPFSVRCDNKMMLANWHLSLQHTFIHNIHNHCIFRAQRPEFALVHLHYSQRPENWIPRYLRENVDGQSARQSSTKAFLCDLFLCKDLVEQLLALAVVEYILQILRVRQQAQRNF